MRPIPYPRMSPMSARAPRSTGAISRLRYDSRMIAAVLFDLDETLLDRTTSLRAFLADQYGRFRGQLGSATREAMILSQTFSARAPRV
jgi:hypothetical protein